MIIKNNICKEYPALCMDSDCSQHLSFKGTVAKVKEIMLEKDKTTQPIIGYFYVPSNHSDNPDYKEKYFAYYDKAMRLNAITGEDADYYIFQVVDENSGELVSRKAEVSMCLEVNQKELEKYLNSLGF